MTLRHESNIRKIFRSAGVTYNSSWTIDITSILEYANLERIKVNLYICTV